MASRPKTRYARSGDADIAYQVLGDGPLDLLFCTGQWVPIDCMDEEPAMARFIRRLSSFARLIRFDARGTGLSERGSPDAPPTCEQRVLDILAVLDAVGAHRPAVLAPFLATPEGITLAATRPERLANLVVLNGSARLLWAPDYPAGIPLRLFDRQVDHFFETDAVESGFDNVALWAPSLADDDEFRAWFDRSGNLGATPAMAAAMIHEVYRTDVRHLLPDVGVPTLVIDRIDIPSPIGPEHGRYIADRIPGAVYRGLPGIDSLYWVGDSGPVLDEIEEFLTGARSGAGAERVLATVLFTDIVGSTDRASRMGDAGWRDLLDRHDRAVRSQLERFRGREVKTVGDGFVATFDSPGRAIECAGAIADAVRPLDLEVRAGIHTGEIELRGGDVAGMAVHIGARVSSLAGPGEVLVSSTVKDLVTGSPVRFADRGGHTLKGVPGEWRIYAVER
jgi:class 3 adenylate cyclase/pimeloyl-ACP methyl ester carboxylesterase